MTVSEPASLLFRLPVNALESTPVAVQPGKYKDLGVLEPQHMEKWLESASEILGEELLVITTQYAKFDKSKKRLDVLALDRAGRLVVVEIKRDSSGSEQELQALHYAAYCSTLKLEEVIDEYHDHHADEDGDQSTETARKTLEEFVIEGSLHGFDEDREVRTILVARSFRPEVTATVLWLIETWGLDISCIELVPYELDGTLLLSSSRRIPLPDAAEFQIKKAEKQQAASGSRKVNWEKAMEVMAAIPEGHWTAYQDLAVAAGGSPRAGMAVGNYLRTADDLPPNCVHRVLRSDGTIAPKWQGVIGGAIEARELLETEGLPFDDKGRADRTRRWKPSS